MKSARARHKVCFDCNKDFFVLSGYNADQASRDNKCEVFNLDGKTFKSISNIKYLIY